MLIDALEGDRINTKGRIAYLGGAHAEGPLLAQSGPSPSRRCRLSADTVAKFENRSTLKISQKLMFRHLYRCNAC
jgi:hypothetical protein